MSVAPGRSMTRAPAALTPASAPTASIFSPLTRTAQPSCMASPSKTRAGFSTVIVSFAPIGACRCRALTGASPAARIDAAIASAPPAANRVCCMRGIIVNEAC